MPAHTSGAELNAPVALSTTMLYLGGPGRPCTCPGPTARASAAAGAASPSTRCLTRACASMLAGCGASRCRAARCAMQGAACGDLAGEVCSHTWRLLRAPPACPPREPVQKLRPEDCVLYEVMDPMNLKVHLFRCLGGGAGGGRGNRGDPTAAAMPHTTQQRGWQLSLHGAQPAPKPRLKCAFLLA